MTVARVLKHQLGNFETHIQMPVGSRVLHAALDPHERPCIWVWTPQHGGQTEDRVFELFGTGEDIPITHHYHGIIRDGFYVWHVFEHNPLGRNLT